jgi:glycosyltransferase involved in cell wall biosynthesis
MRSIPYILREREKLHIFIVGGAQGGYGAKPENGETWKEIFYNEIKGSLTNSQKQRIHFVGYLDYQRYLNLLSISSAHVYLTYPFVLSWSLLEAMSLGIPIIASDTPPVQEIIRDEYNGSLFNFFDFKALAESVVNTLSNTEHRLKLSTNARQTIQEKYDLEKICLPRQVEWVYKSMQEVSKTNLVS